MSDWTAEQTAAAQAASGAEWRRRAAVILANHQPVTDRDDSTVCKLCGFSTYGHGNGAAPAEQEPPLSPEEEEALF